MRSPFAVKREKQLVPERSAVAEQAEGPSRSWWRRSERPAIPLKDILPEIREAVEHPRGRITFFSTDESAQQHQRLTNSIYEPLEKKILEGKGAGSLDLVNDEIKAAYTDSISYAVRHALDLYAHLKYTLPERYKQEGKNWEQEAEKFLKEVRVRIAEMYTHPLLFEAIKKNAGHPEAVSAMINAISYGLDNVYWHAEKGIGIPLPGEGGREMAPEELARFRVSRIMPRITSDAAMEAGAKLFELELSLKHRDLSGEKETKLYLPEGKGKARQAPSFDRETREQVKARMDGWYPLTSDYFKALITTYGRGAGLAAEGIYLTAISLQDVAPLKPMDNKGFNLHSYSPAMYYLSLLSENRAEEARVYSEFPRWLFASPQLSEIVSGFLFQLNRDKSGDLVFRGLSGADPDVLVAKLKAIAQEAREFAQSVLFSETDERGFWRYYAAREGRIKFEEKPSVEMPVRLSHEDAQAEMMKRIGELESSLAKGNLAAHRELLARISKEFTGSLLPAYFETGKADSRLLRNVLRAFHPDTKPDALKTDYDYAARQVFSEIERCERGQ